LNLRRTGKRTLLAGVRNFRRGDGRRSIPYARTREAFALHCNPIKRNDGQNRDVAKGGIVRERSHG